MMQLPHNLLTLDTLIKLGTAVTALMGLFKFFRRYVKPVFVKVSEFIDGEIELRRRTREMILDYEKVKPALAELFEMFDWYQKMKLYADVKIVPRTREAAAGDDTVIKTNGETH